MPVVSMSCKRAAFAFRRRSGSKRTRNVMLRQFFGRWAGPAPSLNPSSRQVPMDWSRFSSTSQWEFRVQWEYGGTATSARPISAMLQAAKKIVASLDEPAEYARVDGILCRDEFVLMELELIEPVLFLRLQSAADRFVEAILNSA